MCVFVHVCEFCFSFFFSSHIFNCLFLPFIKILQCSKGGNMVKDLNSQEKLESSDEEGEMQKAIG